jgi:dual specificity tyrosine-phosphorylation-regulated kinase 2/3/4
MSPLNSAGPCKQPLKFYFRLNSPAKEKVISKLATLDFAKMPSANTTQAFSPSVEICEVLTAASALRTCIAKLTDYEQSEILAYKQVYFLSTHKLCPTQGQPNFGFDDEKGFYKITVGDQIAFRYEAMSLIGSGSFGQVVKCFDHKLKEEVALKVIRNRSNFHKQGAVEVKVLEKLRELADESNTIHMKNSFVFRNHLVISFELLSMNLYEFLKLNRFEGLSMTLTRRFATQILLCLKHLKEVEVLHCDLKPENVLLKETNKAAVKVIDFGSSCFKQERVFTYIQSRFYRAPEIMLGLPYSFPIDMWSFGCLIAELHSGYPLFPGENEHQQLLRIIEVLGLPPKGMLTSASRGSQFFNSAGEPIVVPDAKGKTHLPLTRTLPRVLNSQDVFFLDFVKKCLAWNPADRMTPEAALQHSWCLKSQKDISRSEMSSPKSRLVRGKLRLLAKF